MCEWVLSVFVYTWRFVCGSVSVCACAHEWTLNITIATSCDSSNFMDSNNKIKPYIVVVKSVASRLSTTMLKAVNCHHVTENWRHEKKIRTKTHTEHGWSLKINNRVLLFFCLSCTLFSNRLTKKGKEKATNRNFYFRRTGIKTNILLLLNWMVVERKCVCILAEREKKPESKWRSMAFATLCSASKCSRLGKSLINNFVGASSTAPTYLRYTN